MSKKSEKINVIIKYPGESLGHVEAIENTLKAFQDLIGGNIEVVYLPKDTVAVINEDGKFRGLKENFPLPWGDVIVGPAVLCGTSGDEFADIPITLGEWGNILETLKKHKTSLSQS